MGQLYLDGVLAEGDWKAFLKQNVYNGEEYSYFYNALASVICQCHFVDMLPDIRYMLDNDLMDEMCLGKYDSCVDYMFEYREWEKNFCVSPMKAADMLKHWSMFEEETKREIGRNDPCSCGSGKKYKFCCLNKPKSPIDEIESLQDRKKCLENYLYIGNNRQADRIYLEDYFDAESIEIDKLLYLGLMNRPGPIWLRDEKKEQIRSREYLTLAFERFKEKIKEEGVHTFEEYDKNKAFYTEVKKCCKKMG